MTNISIAGRRIGPDQSPYVIAELSGNHNGQLDRALASIAAAKAAGADAIKLQTYTADTMTIDHDGPGFVIEGGLWHGRSLYDLYKEAGTPWDWHRTLFEKAKEMGITIFSTPFDASAVAFLEELGAPAYKIASFELTDLPLIERVAATSKPVIMSTGMGDLTEITEAVEAARRGGCTELALLHCISGYPTAVEDSNLATIPDLSRRFQCVVGLSDHTLGTAVSVAGAALGAAIIEKHFTLRRADGGVDSAFSIEPSELEQLVHDSRMAHAALGSISYDRKPSERGNVTYRRSLYAVRDIAAGELLTTESVRSIRPGHGLPPKHLPTILGQRAKIAIRRGEPLTWDMVNK